MALAGLLAACGPTPEPQPPAAAPASDRGSAIVVRVVDGDTVVVALAGTDTTIRLLNVDTPETKDPNKAVECLGPEASAFLTELLPVGTPVELVYDGEKLDRYGRTLAGVFKGDVLTNAEIARAGLGVPVQFNGQVKFLPPVEAAAAEAERTGVGAYAGDVDCALLGQADEVLAELEAVADPSKETARAYAATIASLSRARKAANEVMVLAETASRTSGQAAWVFHDAVRSGQRGRVGAAVSDADRRIDDLRSTMAKLKKKEAAERQRESEKAERAAVRTRAAERMRQQAAEKRNSDNGGGSAPKKSGGGSSLDGYTGPRCYAPGGKTWKPC